MRPDDDDQDLGGSDDSLADGLDETVVHGAFSTSSDPYGDGLGDDSYGDDSYGDDSDGDDDTAGTAGDDDTAGTAGDGGDDSYGDDAPDAGGAGGGYGDGSADEGGGAGDDDGSILVGQGGDDGLDAGSPSLDDLDLTVHSGSPLEGVGFLLDEIGDALFGDDAAAAATAASPFDQDPADVGADADLDLTGDGVVDRADLHEAGSVFDFRPGDGHHGGHEGA